jgi:crotonobetainyl-CoA:carnitine CoA-transferase CaiB-like acyl-CoA transferase
VTDPENEPPIKAGGQQADMLTAWTAASATMSAVFHRDLTGEGQHVDISEVETVAHMIRPNTALYSHEPPDGPNRSRFLRRTKWGLAYVFPCQDGHIALLALTDQHWESLKVLMGRPEWAESELFTTLLSRFQNIDALDVSVAAWVADQKRDELMAPHNVYRSKGDDTWVAIAVESEEEWRSLCQAVGHPEWIEDKRFADRQSRKAHEQELDALLAAWTKERTNTDIMHQLQKVGVAATPVFDTESLLNDPQFQTRDFLVSPPHPVTGGHAVSGIPGKYSAFEPRYTPVPCLGQDTEAVCRELLGLSQEEIAQLQEEKVLH